MRPLAELRDVADPGWPILEAIIAAAEAPVTVLPVEPARGERTLFRLQVTAHSFLGALALHTGGLLVDHGWLRVLGGGGQLLNLATANGLDGRPDPGSGQLLIAFDILGGKFAINGGALPGHPGEVCYFAPDELAWIPLEMSHSSFVAWSMTPGLGMFYEHLRWTGWEIEVGSLALDEGLCPSPFPFTKEGQDMSVASRGRVPITELLALWEDLAGQASSIPDGAQFVVVIEHLDRSGGPKGRSSY